MDPAVAKRLQKQYENEMAQLKEMNSKLEQLGEPRQKVLQQLTENEMVQKELDILDDDNKVYKLVGPVLVLQDLDEAKQNLKRRLNYLTKQQESIVEEQKSVENKQQKLRLSMQKIENTFRQAQQKAVANAQQKK